MKACLCVLVVFVTAIGVCSQELPSKIRGYKVYRAGIRVSAAKTPGTVSAGEDAVVKLSEPEAVSVSLTGITLEVNAAVAATERSGRVEFISFKDLKVQGVPVAVEEYQHPFSFEKGVSTTLPSPVRLSLGISTLAKAALFSDLRTRETWHVTGTAFVFGKFRRLGFTFKRVIPIDIDLTIPNPLASAPGPDMVEVIRASEGLNCT